MIQSPSVPRPQRPICLEFGRPIFPCRPLVGPAAYYVLPLAVSGSVWYTEAVSRPHKGLLFFVLWCQNGAQLYKNMLLQDMPPYSLDLRKRPFHAGLRPLPIKRFAAL